MLGRGCPWLCAAVFALPTSVMSQEAAAPVASHSVENPAQNAVKNPAGSTAGAASAATELEVILVTAQRRTESLQDVPISLAVVTGDSLQQRSIQTFEQLAPLVPNLTIAKSPAANLIILRGIGSSPGSPSLDQSVVMFVDGIYGGNARQFSTPFLDIERLEILRGPQGALVGRNTSAGAINIITRKPGTELGGYLNASYNLDFEGPTLEGGIDWPASDSLRFRVVGKFADQDGYLRNTYLGEDQPNRREQVGRITGVFDNGGPLTVTAKYEHSQVDSNGIPTQLLSPSHGHALDFAKDTFISGAAEFDDIDSDIATLQFDLDLGGATLVSITGYSAFENVSLVDGDFYSGEFATAIFNQDFEQLSQEVRLVSSDEGRWLYVIGAYYSTADLFEQRTTGVLFAPPASTYREFTQQNDVYSLFGQLTYKITDQWRVNASGRYTRESKDAHYQRFGGPLAAVDFTGELVADIHGDLKVGRFDPAVSLQYELSDYTMLYGSWGKGSKSGGFQGAIGNATQEGFEFGAETSTSYELGAKFSFPGLGYLNASAFYTVYKDLQVSAQVPTHGSLTALIFTGNAPEARVAGVEAEFLLNLSPMFRVDGSLAWLPEARYVTFTSGPCYPLQVPNGSVPNSCDVSDQRLGFAPRFSASLNLTATVPLGSGLNVVAALSPRYQGDSYRDFSPDPATEQQAFTKLDARLGIAAADGRWEVAVLGQNLTNELTIGFGGSAGLANTFLDPGAHLAAVDPPRNISLQGKIHF